MNQSKRVDHLCTWVNGLHGLGYCAVEVFATVYLTARGVNDSLIGFMHVIACILTMVLDLWISNLMDHNQRISGRKVILTTIAFCLLITVCIVLIHLPVIIMVLYAILYGLILLRHCILDTMVMSYINANVASDYGKPRSINSLCYAMGSSVFGILIAKNPTLIPILIPTIFSIIMVFFLLRMPEIHSQSTVTSDTREESYIKIIQRNPAFFLFLLAAMCSAIGQSGMGTYLIRLVERVGGNASQLGITILIEAGLEVPIFMISSKLLKRFSCDSLLIFSFICYAIKMLLIITAQSMAMIYIGASISVFCFGIFGFASVYYANSIVGDKEKARSQALLSFFRSSGIGGILGNLMNGFFVQYYGLDVLLTIQFVFCLASIGCMILSSIYLRRKSTHN